MVFDTFLILAMAQAAEQTTYSEFDPAMAKFPSNGLTPNQLLALTLNFAIPACKFDGARGSNLKGSFSNKYVSCRQCDRKYRKALPSEALKEVTDPN